jgi:hypothetical protein
MLLELHRVDLNDFLDNPNSYILKVEESGDSIVIDGRNVIISNYFEIADKDLEHG